MTTRAELDAARAMLLKAYEVGDFKMAGEATAIMRRWLDEHFPSGGARNKKGAQATAAETLSKIQGPSIRKGPKARVTERTQTTHMLSVRQGIPRRRGRPRKLPVSMGTATL